MQADTGKLGFLQAVDKVKATGGYRGFFRGITAIAVGAAPAHAVYFSAYELAKKNIGKLGYLSDSASYSVAGVIATVCSYIVFNIGFE